MSEAKDKSRDRQVMGLLKSEPLNSFLILITRSLNHNLLTSKKFISAFWVIFHAFAVVCQFFFGINFPFFKKLLSGTLLECQTVWIQISTDFSSILIWLQTVCKGYQQTTKVSACRHRVRDLLLSAILCISS